MGDRVFLIIPARNEAPSLPGLLAEIRRDHASLTVVVIDDGSSDATAHEARKGGALLLRHPYNLGYGAALQTGYRFALEQGAQLVAQMDADGQHPPGELPGILEPVRRRECDLCVGSRFLEPGDTTMGATRRLGRQLLRGLARLGGLHITDPTSGFQAMNRRALELFVSDWYPYDYPDVDVLLLAHRRGLRVAERPVRMRAGWRDSTLHSGVRPLYYAYKMLLSLWALSAVPRAERGAPRSGAGEPGAGDGGEKWTS